MPLVSVVIPCYNQSRFIGTALSSLIAQSLTDWEAWIIDDGSPDDVAMAVRDYVRSDSRIQYLRQENQGLPSARNVGLAHSHGKYINFLDADDWFHPSKLEKQVRIMEEEPAIDWVYCDIVQEREDAHAAGESSMASSRRVLDGDLMESLLIGGFFPPHTVLIRRTVLDVCGTFRVEMGGHADYDLWLRVAALGHQARFVNEPLAHYRIHSDGMSRDFAHMEQTRRAALRRVVTDYPERVAASLDGLFRTNRDYEKANWWLNSQLATRQQEIERLNSVIGEQKDWIAQLSEGKAWLEQQVTNWRTEADALSAEVAELKKVQATAQQTRWKSRIRAFVNHLGGRK